MRRVGTVVRTAQGLAVVRSSNEQFPAVGTGLVDESIDDVGTVVEVFGPVDRPYLAVNPVADISVPALLGTPLYAR